jgi:Ras-related protein Rab-18
MSRVSESVRGDYDHVVKLLLVGDSGVGKTSLLLCFASKEFKEDMKSTIGMDLKLKHVTIRGRRLKLTIWDTAGQERFRTLTSAYYRGALGVIIVYDVTRRETFDNIKDWIKEIDMHSTHEDAVRMLIANKIDQVGCLVFVVKSWFRMGRGW